MKDRLSIMFANAIRMAGHKRNELGRELTDKEVWLIAAQIQYNYHASEAVRFLKTTEGAVRGKTHAGPAAAGNVTHPEDLDEAARKGMSEIDYKRFINEYGKNFTAKQLVEYCDRLRAIG